MKSTVAVVGVVVVSVDAVLLVTYLVVVAVAACRNGEFYIR